MQQAHVQERVEFAALGYRAAAVMVDTLIVLVAYSVVLAIAARAGWSQLAFMKNLTLGDISTASRQSPGWFMPVMYALVFVYFTLFELRGWTPGKRIFRLQVAREDGTPASPTSIILRNLVRIPEMLLYYIPSGISCLASPRNKRLGDYAGGTVVLRRSPAAGAPAASTAFGAQPAATAPLAPPAPAATGPAAQSPSAAPRVADALAALKTAALAVRGAHLNYLRFSERELAREPGAAAYTPEYEAAWYTLADAVMALQHAYAEAAVAATVAGTSIQEQAVNQPDLTYLFGELEPYLAAGSDEEVHEAYLRVARSEIPA